jgi:hypothetical protein
MIHRGREPLGASKFLGEPVGFVSFIGMFASRSIARMRAASPGSSPEVPAPGSAAHAMPVHRDPGSGCGDRQEAMSTPTSEPFTDENVWRTPCR